MNIKTFLLALGLLAGFFNMPAIYAQSPLQAQNSSQTVTLDIQNMTCALCKITIKKALQNISGVKQVNVNFAAKTAEVTFDPNKTGSEALISATTNAGYPATIRRIK